MQSWASRLLIPRFRYTASRLRLLTDSARSYWSPFALSLSKCEWMQGLRQAQAERMLRLHRVESIVLASHFSVAPLPFIFPVFLVHFTTITHHFVAITTSQLPPPQNH